MVTESPTLLQIPTTCDTITPEREPYQPPSPRWIPIVLGGKLAFRFDPERGLIEWKGREQVYVVDLAAIGG